MTEYSFDKDTERETIKKMNSLFGFGKRSYYNSDKAKERYQKNKQVEIQKHIDNCREESCPLKNGGVFEDER